MTGRSFTPNDENSPLAHPPKHRTANDRERSMQMQPLPHGRGSVSGIFRAAAKVTERPMADVHRSLTAAAQFRFSFDIRLQASRRLTLTPPFTVSSLIGAPPEPSVSSRVFGPAPHCPLVIFAPEKSLLMPPWTVFARMFAL